jgi:hypothetical protein
LLESLDQALESAEIRRCGLAPRGKLSLYRRVPLSHAERGCGGRIVIESVDFLRDLVNHIDDTMSKIVNESIDR